MVSVKLLWVHSATVIAGVALAIGAPESHLVAHNRQTQVTWTTDVEPILSRRCIGCHSAGGFGPMSLATYQDAREWAKTIRREVLERRMPPWPAARGFGDFVNDRSLTPVEVELLTAWADGATPVGPPVDRSRAPAATGLARTDFVAMMPAPREVSALVDRIELPTSLDGDRWVTGWEFRPGNRSIVQQAVLWILDSQRTFVGAWTPPDGASNYPAGVAQRLPAGSRLLLELHYRKSAAPETDRSGVAFRFGARPQRELRHRTLACDSTTIDRDIDALAVTPLATEAGASIEIIARPADGRVEPLSVVPRYAPEYPVTYRFRKAVRLPGGTTIDVRSSAPGCAVELEFVALR